MTLQAKPVRRRAQRGSGERLRAEIVTETKRLLAATGRADEVSIRSVADAVGVTPPSIYLHFADKEALITAVVADVFTDLDHAMLAAAAGAATPLDRLRACGQAYVAWAVQHPEHYRIATMDPCVRPDVDNVLSEGAFANFSKVVADCIAEGTFSGETLPITIGLWSAAHGLASLMIAKPFLPWDQLPDLVDEVLCASALGHAAAGVVGYTPAADDVTRWVKAQKRGRARRG